MIKRDELQRNMYKKETGTPFLNTMITFSLIEPFPYNLYPEICCYLSMTRIPLLFLSD